MTGGQGQESEAKSSDIARMQDGVKSWVRRAAREGGHGIRELTPPALLSMLCASAFAPLAASSAGVTDAAVVASTWILSSVGSGALTGVITGALDRLRASNVPANGRTAELEREMACQLERALVADDAAAQALRLDIAAVLTEIDMSGTVLRTAVEVGNEQLRNDVIVAIGTLGTSIADMGTLFADVMGVAAEIQQGLDEQGATSREILDRSTRLSTDVRLMREQLERAQTRPSVGIASGLKAGDTTGHWKDESPYKGLASFDEADAEVFYGRERLTAKLAVEMDRHRMQGGLIVVTGASGAGKSSLVRAGLLPALAHGLQVQGAQEWPRIVITPGADPLTELAVRLAVLAGTDATAVRAALACNPGQVHSLIRQAIVADVLRRKQHDSPSAVDNSRLVLIVDQFEQVFTLDSKRGGDVDRQAFITALDVAAAPGLDKHAQSLVLLVVRGDFCDRCAQYPELARALNESAFFVGPMTESELRLTITGPAEVAGLRIDPNLSNTILADLRGVAGQDTAGVLPLLSQAMLLTWENREGDRLTSRGYAQTGGVSRAVETSADAVFNSLPVAQRKLAQDMLRNMTIVGPDGRLARRPLSRNDLSLGSNADQVNAVLEAFAARRLIVLDNSTAQISHDALLTAWPRLRGWLDDDQASWIMHAQFSEDAAAWRDHGEDPSFLYRGTQLTTLRQAIQAWSAASGRYPALTAPQRDFWNASERDGARRFRQRQLITMSLVFLLVASLIAGGLAIAGAINANRQRNLAIAQRDLALSGQLAVRSEEFDTTDPVTAAWLAAASWRNDQTSQARESLLQVLAQPLRAALTGGALSSGGSQTVAFSPSGRVLATVARVGGVQLWDAATYRRLGSVLIQRHSKRVNAVAFSPDGRILAAAGPAGVQLWGVARRLPIGSPITVGHNTRVDSVAFSPDGKVLAIGTGNGMVRLWGIASHHELGSMLKVTKNGGVNTLVYSSQSPVLAAEGDGGFVVVWNTVTNRRWRLPFNFLSQAMALSADGKSLATVDISVRFVRIWDVASGRQVARLPASTGVNAVAFSPDGRVIVTAGSDGTARLWDPATGHPIGGTLAATSAGPMTAVAFSPTGSTLATASSDGTTRLWNIALLHQVGRQIITGGRRVDQVAFSPDGKTIAMQDPSGTVRLWGATSRHQVWAPLVVPERFGKGGGLPGTIAFSPHGKLLAVALQPVWLFDAGTHRRFGGTIDAAVGRNGQFVVAVAFSPNGGVLATEDTFGSVRLWSVATQHMIGRTIDGGEPNETALDFSPDGKLLIMLGAYGIRIWNVVKHRRAGFIGVSGGDPEGMAMSPDGRLLATVSGEGVVQLWNMASHAEVGAPMTGGHSWLGPVFGLAFSPRGSLLATVVNNNLELWDVATQHEIGEPIAVPGGADSVVFSPNGKTLATGGDDGTLRFWDVTFPPNLVGAVCSIVGGPVTRKQWNTYVPGEPYRPVCP